MPLAGSDRWGPALEARATDFAPLLLKCAVQVADLSVDVEPRRTMLDLADGGWVHLLAQPCTAPSWRHTLRMVESLRLAALLAVRLPEAGIPSFAASLLAEAEERLDEQSAGSDPHLREEIGAIRSSIRRAREILPMRPAGATTLLLDGIRRLDELAAENHRHNGSG